MLLSDARRLLQSAPLNKTHPQTWADLGCGDGLFTRALERLLPAGSQIYGVDRTKRTLPEPLRFIQANFEQDDLPLTRLTGILMANSLHYVRDKEALLRKLKGYMPGEGLFLIVEYDTMKANPYVPYPIDFAHLEALFGKAHVGQAVRLEDRPSAFGKVQMYAAAILVTV